MQCILGAFLYCALWVFVDVSGMCSVFLYYAGYLGGISVLCSVFGGYFCIVRCILGASLYCAVYFEGMSVIVYTLIITNDKSHIEKLGQEEEEEEGDEEDNEQ